jgi:hypothetical protein
LTRINYVVKGTINGTASQILPAGVGTDGEKPPLVACYFAYDVTRPYEWIPVSGQFTAGNTPYCSLTYDAGVWTVIMSNLPRSAPLNYYAAFVVVY